MIITHVLGRIIPEKLKTLVIKAIGVPVHYFFYNQLKIRRATTDLKVFIEIFMLKELYLPEFKSEPKTIIDCGAYTGLSTYYLSKKYPSAKIYAIEPEKNNFQTLLKNTETLNNVSATNAAIWYENTTLHLVNEDEEEWSFKFKGDAKSKRKGTKAISLNSFLKKNNILKIDIIKIDIEGAEKELFRKNLEWMDVTNMISIELHDRFEEGCSEIFFKNISKKVWNIKRRGEKVIVFRKQFI